MLNPRFPVPSIIEIEKYKEKFRSPIYKNANVSSGLLRLEKGIPTPYVKNDSSSSCQSNDVPDSESVNINQLYTAYEFPNNGNVKFTNPPLIAVVDYNSAENLQSSMDSFCQNNNIPSTTLNIVPVQNPPSTTDGEQYADTQLIHSFCINADIVVVQASSSSIQDMAVAIQVAKSYNPNIINMSWGVDESSFSQNEYNNLSTLFTGNIIYCASSGDNGSNYVPWPSSDPNVVSVGALSLVLNSDNTIRDQEAWACSGCGPSKFSPQPVYQSVVNTGTTFRATPDLSFNGNPYSGIQLNINGTTETIGGTSVAAPIMSGFFSLVNGFLLNTNAQLYNSIATSPYCIQTLLYSAVNQENYNTLYYDVTKGRVGKFKAQKGWDYTSGCGAIIAIAMFNYLTGNTTNPSEVSTNTDDVQQPSFSASRIVSRPRLWPASFTKPEVSQNVCIKTYIFKNGTDIQKFIKFVEGSFPNYVIDIKQNEDGSTSVSLTSTSVSASNYEKVNGSNYTGSCPLTDCTGNYVYSKENFLGTGFAIWKMCTSKKKILSSCTFYVCYSSCRNRK